MNVLHLSTFDVIGGAARAAYRIHQGLRCVGLKSQMLVQKQASHDPDVIAPKSLLGQSAGRIRSELDKLALQAYPSRSHLAFDPQNIPDGLSSQIAQIAPDIINLHWVLRGYLHIESLARMGKPIVWTLMDMWPFTGGCSYTQECDRYHQGCGACPQLGSVNNYDLSRRIWQRKSRSWENINLTIISPSQWLANCAKSSALFRELRVEVIPFGLDETVYKPIDKKAARSALNLPLDKKLILFGAISATQDKRKGFHLLQPALQQLAQSSLLPEAHVVIFGASKPENDVDMGFQSHYLGHLHDDVSLVLAYSAADVFVAPSLQEAFGQTASEAMACGTPVVAFDGTGLADIVDHHQNGYLATPFESGDLARGIQWLLENDADRRMKICSNARQKVEQEFTLEIQGRRYLKLYSDIIHQNSYIIHQKELVGENLKIKIEH